MTTFALVFMIISMTLVTILTGYCLARVLKSDVETDDEPTSPLSSLPHD
ncbi:MAG: hypothetical protein R3244_08525 [Thermoanaerobaculia bacterium]|nr:hypothetical protein [Thermoanaerobaculia bacterium]